MKIGTGLLAMILSRMFDVSRDVSRDMAPQLAGAARVIATLGVKRMREMVFALPMFVLFVRELLRRRHEFEAQKSLFIIGAASALSTLALVLLGTALGSLWVQVLLLFSHPAIGIGLLTSGSLFIGGIMVVLVWLIVYALNLVLGDDPAFRRIRDEFLSPAEKSVLEDVHRAVETSGSAPEEIIAVVARGLKEKGRHADAGQLERTLLRMQGVLKPKGVRRVRTRSRAKQPSAARQEGTA